MRDRLLCLDRFKFTSLFLILRFFRWSVNTVSYQQYHTTHKSGAEHCFKMSSLTSLDLSRNPTFGIDGLTNFFITYTACNRVYSLKSLYLCNAGLDGSWVGLNGYLGLQCLNDFICNPLCHITILDISENPLLLDQGIQPLLKGIAVYKTLVHLNLAETSLRCRETAGVIAMLLMGNKVRT